MEPYIMSIKCHWVGEYSQVILNMEAYSFNITSNYIKNIDEADEDKAKAEITSLILSATNYGLKLKENEKKRNAR